MKLVTLIASHIDCRKRLQMFIKMLSTINEQIDYYDDINVRISLSKDPDISIEEIRFLVNKLAKNNFIIYYQDIQKSQFEHYKFLVEQINDPDDNNTWILFSDDDDEWAPNRLGAYHHMINSIPASYKSSTMSICYADNSNNSDNSDNSDSGLYVGPYTNYCIKLKYLSIFIAYLTPEQLKHKYCDCYLIKFIKEYGATKLRKGFSNSNDTLYYWNTEVMYCEPKSTTFHDAILNYLDLYLAQSSKPTAKEWLTFSKECFKNKELTTEQNRELVKTYLDIYDHHIFHSKNLPKYID